MRWEKVDDPDEFSGSLEELPETHEPLAGLGFRPAGWIAAVPAGPLGEWFRGPDAWLNEYCQGPTASEVWLSADLVVAAVVSHWTDAPLVAFYSRLANGDIVHTERSTPRPHTADAEAEAVLARRSPLHAALLRRVPRGPDPFVPAWPSTRLSSERTQEQALGAVLQRHRDRIGPTAASLPDLDAALAVRRDASEHLLAARDTERVIALVLSRGAAAVFVVAAGLMVWAVWRVSASVATGVGIVGLGVAAWIGPVARRVADGAAEAAARRWLRGVRRDPARAHRCPYCHERVQGLEFQVHLSNHEIPFSDGSIEVRTLPPEERYTGALPEAPPWTYVHAACGEETSVDEDVLRTWIAAPRFYPPQTWCADCNRFVPQATCRWVASGEPLSNFQARLERGAFP